MVDLRLALLLHFSDGCNSLLQGPLSNFEIEGGGTISDSILRGHKTLFRTNSL